MSYLEPILVHPVRRQIFGDTSGQTFYMTRDPVLCIFYTDIHIWSCGAKPEIYHLLEVRDGKPLLGSSCLHPVVGQERLDDLSFPSFKGTSQSSLPFLAGLVDFSLRHVDPQSQSSWLDYLKGGQEANLLLFRKCEQVPMVMPQPQEVVLLRGDGVAVEKVQVFVVGDRPCWNSHFHN